MAELYRNFRRTSPEGGILRVCTDDCCCRSCTALQTTNIRCDELCLLLRHLGFDVGVRGSHHIFTREGIQEILNVQPRGSMATPYQVDRFATSLSVINWRKGWNEQV